MSYCSVCAALDAKIKRLEDQIAERIEAHREEERILREGAKRTKERLNERIASLEADNAALREDKERLNYLDAHLNSLSTSGYGADDVWFEMLYCDGNKVDGATVRNCIDAARKPNAKRFELLEGSIEDLLGMKRADLLGVYICRQTTFVHSSAKEAHDKAQGD